MLDLPRDDVDTIGALTIPDKAAISVPSHERAFDRTGGPQEGRQSLGRAAPARIVEARGVTAGLAALWGVDAIETDPLAVDLDRGCGRRQRAYQVVCVATDADPFQTSLAIALPSLARNDNSMISERTMPPSYPSLVFANADRAAD